MPVVMRELRPHIAYRDGVLRVEECPLDALAEAFGTPLYIYSRAAVESAWRAYDRAFGTHPHRICYAVKANANLGVLSLLARLGSGFDIVSQGELERVLAAGGDPAKVVFSGVGKTAQEMRRALEAGIGCFNVESAEELARLDAVAGAMGVKAPVSLRVNPDVDARTHPYISTGLKENKFGVAIDQAPEVYRAARDREHIEILGLDCHIGSQLTDLEPFMDALDRILRLIAILERDGIRLRHLDLGGGLGIRYREECPPAAETLIHGIRSRLRDSGLEALIEPGRSIVGNAGLLLTRVEYVKHTPDKDFAIVDAAMNDLARPALYDAWHDIEPVRPRADAVARAYDVVGPVCETGDFLGKGRVLAVEEGDLLAVLSAGAYGFSMSSNYNSRPRAAEVLVDGADAQLVRARESIRDLMRGERCWVEGGIGGEGGI